MSNILSLEKLKSMTQKERLEWIEAKGINNDDHTERHNLVHWTYGLQLMGIGLEPIWCGELTIKTV